MAYYQVRATTAKGEVMVLGVEAPAPGAAFRAVMARTSGILWGGRIEFTTIDPPGDR